ncbi:hypothetical protein D3C72_2583330 [compost metagenome]
MRDFMIFNAAVSYIGFFSSVSGRCLVISRRPQTAMAAAELSRSSWPEVKVRSQ